MNEVTKIVLFTTTAFLVSAAIFFCAGWFGRPEEDNSPISSSDQSKLNLMNSYLTDKLDVFPVSEDISKVDGSQIRSHLFNMSVKPHVAGLEQDEVLVNYVKDTWEAQGLDEVVINTYNMLLSYPDPDKPNLITLENDEDGVFFESTVRESIPDLDENFVDAFLAYSPAGSAQGEVVYVNYGRVEDFQELAGANPDYFTDVTGKICMARYGKIFRGNKIWNAQDAGCIGLVIFSDPEDVAGEGLDNVYPDTIFLPGDGIQRGTVKPLDGDPQTPNWPSLDKAYRLSEGELELPAIPAQPIGYNDAINILKQLEGKAAPPDWVGGINDPDVDYNLGGSFKASCGTNCLLRLESHNRLRSTANSNVLGFIRGDLEPDRYVLFGNHRDSWGYGSVDALSGGSQFLEVTRILGEKMRNEGWRPRRTMVFCSWGAEEYGLLGSREFTEDFMVKLMERAVAYINVDICSSGPILEADASPMIMEQLMDAIKTVPDPWDSSQTYYDFWNDWHGQGVEPAVRIPGASSDHASFIFYLGIPSINFAFDSDSKAHPTLAGNQYPSYHTGYETFQYIDTVVDPGFKVHETCSQLVLLLGRQFSDSLVQSFKPSEYHDLMSATMTEFETTGILDRLRGYEVDIDSVLEQIDAFGGSAQAWQAAMDSSNAAANPLLARQMNDQVSKLERVLILNQESLHHSPRQLHAIDTSDDPVEIEAKKVQLRMHVSDLMIVIKAAADYLKDLPLIA